MNSQRLRNILKTDSGMFGIWDENYFYDVIDYDSWEQELLEDNNICNRIKLGHLVPININSDGAFEFEIRVGDDAELNVREKKYTLVSSEPYLFRSQGKLNISGIEFIEKDPDESVGSLVIPSGSYQVYIHLIDWEDEPNSKESDGKPLKDALPDFLVLLKNYSESSSDIFRTKIESFDTPA
jgi:hypothetical protein